MASNEFLIQPYMYEPVYAEGEERDIQESDSDNNCEDIDLAERVGNVDWCECRKCSPMTAARENICCQEWSILFPKLEACDDCITTHPDFDTICLTPAVLLMAYVQHLIYKGIGGIAPDVLANRQSRLMAYRNYISWSHCGQRLGKGVRKVIPSCVVSSIRKRFPGTDYTGFHEVNEALTLMNDI